MKRIYLLLFYLLIIFFAYRIDYKLLYLQINMYYEMKDVIIEFDELSEMQIGKFVELPDSLFSENALYLRYSKLTCQVCVDETFQILSSKFSSPRLNEVLIVFIDYENKRLLNSFKDRNQLTNIKTIYLPENQIFPEVEDLKIPYFFTLDNYGKVNSFFIVMREFQFRTKWYLRSHE